MNNYSPAPSGIILSSFSICLRLIGITLSVLGGRERFLSIGLGIRVTTADFPESLIGFAPGLPRRILSLFRRLLAVVFVAVPRPIVSFPGAVGLILSPIIITAGA